MSKSVGEKLLSRTPFRVRILPTHEVELEINGRSWAMDYDTAINVAAMLNWAGRKAKARAGDGSMRVLGIADLTDAELDEREIQRSRDGTAVLARAK